MSDQWIHHRLAVAFSRGMLFAIAMIVADSVSPGNRAQAETPTAPTTSPGGDYAISQVALIDEHISGGWEEHKIRPSKPATAGEWCRRVYLDLLGRVPSVDELEEFTRERSSRKKEELVDRLLGEAGSADFVVNWTTIWTNVLIGRTGGTERRTLTSRPGMQRYLRDSIAENKPYDKMVYELISASGSTKPGTDDFNGATNFLAGKLADNGIQATAKTSQIFLGIQVQCTQCHNHPFNENKQNQFWEMNAFFRQTRALRSFDGRDIAGVRLADQDFAGDGGDPNDAEIFYELRNGLLRTAYPVFVDGSSLAEIYASCGETVGNSGYLSDIGRREELAKLVVASPLLEKAVVNRIWSHFLGYGFTKPVDDMGPHNPPSHPELLEKLATELRIAEFDLKQLMRWIVLSEPYALGSRMGRDQATRGDPSIGTRPLFSHFYLRQMQAEELYESLLVATGAAKTIAPGDRDEVKARWLRQFSSAFNTDENDEATTFNGSIPQSLMMMNGELVRRACGTKRGSFLYEIATDESMKNKDKIRHLYLAALARRPTGDEITAANRLVELRKGEVAAALQDIWWALLNSNEFILNH